MGWGAQRCACGDKYFVDVHNSCHLYFVDVHNSCHLLVVRGSRCHAFGQRFFPVVLTAVSETDAPGRAEAEPPCSSNYS